MTNSTETPKNIRLLNPGPLDAWYGPYESISAACIALPDIVSDGLNFRLGKIVGVYTSTGILKYEWPGPDFSDTAIKELLSEHNFDNQLQSSIDEQKYDYINYGTILVGSSTSFDVGTANSVSYNSALSLISSAAELYEIDIELALAGTIYFSIGTSNGVLFNKRKTIGPFTGVLGHNVFLVSEAINIGEIIALGGAAGGTGKFKFGSSGGPTGNHLRQEPILTGTATNSADGSYISYFFKTRKAIPGPLSIFPKKSELPDFNTFIQAGEKFTNALQQEIDRIPSNIDTIYGTMQIGASTSSNVGTLNDFYFNSVLNKINTNENLIEITIQSGVNGTVYLSLGTSDGNFFTKRKTLPVFNVVPGSNIFIVNEPVLAGEYLAVGGASGGTATFKFGYNGSGTNRLFQMKPPGGSAKTDFGANTYISLSFKTRKAQPKPLDIYPKKTDLPDTSVFALKSELPDTSKFVQAITRITKTIKKDGIAGVDCDFAGNRAIQDFIDSVIDASAIKLYDGSVFPGIYHASQVSDLNAGGVTTGQVSWVKLKSFTSLIGTDVITCIVSVKVASNLSSSIYQNLQNVLFNANQSFLQNLTIMIENGRYPIHSDGEQLGNKNYYSKIQNCRVFHKGNFDNALTGWTSVTALGLGTSDGQVMDVIDTYFESGIWCYYFHSNLNFANASTTNYIRCKATNIGTNKRAVKLQSLGSHRNDIIRFENCSWSNAYLFQTDDNPYIPTALKDQHYNHCDLKVVGYGNDSFVYEPNFKGFALKIKSKSTGSGSTVRFDINSTAFPLIMKNKDVLTGIYVDDLLEVNTDGYAYNDGEGVLSGYAIGRLDIGGEGVGIASNQYVKSLGKRLGDCSTINKTLTIIIDGTTYNIVFNKNYVGSGIASTSQSDYTNSQIIAEISAIIGSVATVTEYAVGNDYYPEFSSGNNQIVISKTLITLQKGMSVVMDNGVIRKATSTDTAIYGVVLDDAKISSNVRVLRRGYIFSVETNRFSTLQDSYTTIIKGDKLGISATDGKINKTATIKHFTAIADGILSFNIN